MPGVHNPRQLYYRAHVRRQTHFIILYYVQNMAIAICVNSNDRLLSLLAAVAESVLLRKFNKVIK